MPVKPSTPEEEFFARQEFERKRSLAQAREQALMEEERKALRERHWMRCPKCGMELVEIAYRGHQIDQCSSCRGVWLDAGELESLSKAEEEGGFLNGLGRLFKD
jgi:hypothetical protein